MSSRQDEKKQLSIRPLNRIIMSFSLVFLGGMAWASDAFAYLDPGTGSMILQLILGGLAGLAAVGKLYWAQIKSTVKSWMGRNDDTDMQNDQGDPKD